MELDSLNVPARVPWLPDLKAESLAFPRGCHDDIVDALGLVGQLLKWVEECRKSNVVASARLMTTPLDDYVALYPRPDDPLLSPKVL